jgi:type VI secretion system protein ImpK
VAIPSVGEFIAAGGNPILRSAMPLLVLAGRLRGQIANADVESLRRQCTQEIRAFEDRLRRANVPAEDVLAARYAMCTVIDEAVLNTPWGAQSTWSGCSLLVTFHREARGGEKFFHILDRLQVEPQRYLGLLELWYVCLAVGFEGRYRLDERGANRLAEIRRDLYTRIGGLRGRPDAELSPHWQGVEDRRNAMVRRVPLWVAAAAAVAVLLGVYLYFDSRLNERVLPLNASLANIGLERLATLAPTEPRAPPPAAAPVQASPPPPGLAKLLAPEVAQGVLDVAEQGERTVITITAPALFASGSARLDPRYEDLMHRIGAALDRVPGRIIITGHTDDQPVHSLQYHDNYELSRARAQNVAQLLKRDVADSSRMFAAGKGDSDPRYQPANRPENRERNRRVEIVHHREG